MTALHRCTAKRLAILIRTLAPTLALALVLAAFSGAIVAPAQAQTEGRTVETESPVGGQVPNAALGANSDSEIWRAVRRGIQGNVSIPDKAAGTLIQSEGDNWRAWRNGPLTVYGAWVMLVMVAFLALFFAVRGRIKIDAGPSGSTVERFNGLERFAHWTSAVSFILLALTGLNIFYGRHVLLPVLGPDIFGALTLYGKYVHNYVSFAFMFGIVLMFVLWVRHNIPNKNDLIWLSKGGGLMVKGVHPPSEKFNAGQKIIFWLVIVGGGSLAVSGIALLFPFQLSMFAATFSILNVFGTDFPTVLTPLQETQYALLWHTIIGVVMIAVILAHIYIGSLGMEGAFAAMGSGQVDRNWAREHHNIWYAELHEGDAAGAGQRQPAE